LEDRYNAIWGLIDDISMKLPQQVTKVELRRLARLGLCQIHGYQRGEIVARWNDILGCVKGINGTYEDQREETIQDLKELQKEVDECRSLLLVKEDCKDALSVVLRRHLNRNARLKKELVESQATCSRLQKGFARVKGQKEENSRLSAENSRLSDLLKRAEGEQERYTNQEITLTAECEKLRKQNAALQADTNSGKDHYKDLQDREQSATMELMATTAQLHEVQSLNLGLENDKKILQSEIDILKQEVEKLNNKNTSVSSQLASAAASLETVTEGLRAAHKENMGFRDELITATREIMELRNKVRQLSTPVWYRMIQWIKQKLSGLRHLRSHGKEVSDAEEGMALAPTVSGRGCRTGLTEQKD
jgi:DNA repair exonuclease SbcCD ATPase subunit